MIWAFLGEMHLKSKERSGEPFDLNYEFLSDKDYVRDYGRSLVLIKNTYSLGFGKAQILYDKI